MLERLRGYWRFHGNRQWLFPGVGRAWRNRTQSLATAMGNPTLSPNVSPSRPRGSSKEYYPDSFFAAPLTQKFNAEVQMRRCADAQRIEMGLGACLPLLL